MMYMRERLNKLIHICCALFAAASLMLSISADAQTVDVMPAFSLQSAVDGKVVTSEDFKGKVLLITFFTTWCPPCRQEVPSLIKLQKKFTSRGFSVIGLSIDEKGPKVVVKLIDKEKINYPVLMADNKTKSDFGGIVGIPTSFLIDRQGKVIKRYPGYVPFSRLEKDIQTIL